jgi:surface antigen
LIFIVTSIICTSHYYYIGKKIDSFNNVSVYYNGAFGTISGRNYAKEGYNLGLKYQCVEFVKRYYYEYYHHKMPDSYGHAKDFFDLSIQDGKHNKKRNLNQYTNPSYSKPKVGDILIFRGNAFNKYGHVAIISSVEVNEIEVIQQNVGPITRVVFDLKFKNNTWSIENNSILGWLRK